MSSTPSFVKKERKDVAAVIKTPQSLIHIKHRISLLQYKYWILLLRELRAQFDAGVPPDENGFRYIPMDKIAADLGYTPNKTELFKDFLALKNETIAFNVLEKDGQEAKYGAGYFRVEDNEPARRVQVPIHDRERNARLGRAESDFSVAQLEHLQSLLGQVRGDHLQALQGLCRRAKNALHDGRGVSRIHGPQRH